MASPCPFPDCGGTLHSRGKGRSPACNKCGRPPESRKQGRPPKGAKPLTPAQKYRKQAGEPRKITYALFDPALLPVATIGVIRKDAFVGIAVGCSRQSVEGDRPGLTAIPFGSLRAKEKKWVYEKTKLPPAPR